MDLASQEYATEVVSYLLSSYPQQASDPEVYGAQLVALCTGRPTSLLRRMINPVEGLVSTAKFLPTLAEVRQWLDAAYPLPAYKPFPPLLEEPLTTPEERNWGIANWEKVKTEMLENMRSAGKIAGKFQPLPQIDDWDKRMKALEHLESMRSKAEEDAI